MDIAETQLIDCVAFVRLASAACSTLRSRSGTFADLFSSASAALFRHARMQVVGVPAGLVDTCPSDTVLASSVETVFDDRERSSVQVRAALSVLAHLLLDGGTANALHALPDCAYPAAPTDVEVKAVGHYQSLHALLTCLVAEGSRWDIIRELLSYAHDHGASTKHVCALANTAAANNQPQILAALNAFAASTLTVYALTRAAELAACSGHAEATQECFTQLVACLGKFLYEFELESHGVTVLQRAAQCGHIGVVQAILNTEPTLTRFWNTAAAVLTACEHKRFDIVAVLLGHHACSCVQRGAGIAAPASAATASASHLESLHARTICDDAVRMRKLAPMLHVAAFCRDDALFLTVLENARTSRHVVFPIAYRFLLTSLVVWRGNAAQLVPLLEKLRVHEILPELNTSELFARDRLELFLWAQALYAIADHRGHTTCLPPLQAWLQSFSTVSSTSNPR